MDLNQKIIAGLLLAFFLITLLRVLRAPLRHRRSHRHHAGTQHLQRAGHRHFRTAGLRPAAFDAVGAVELHSSICRGGPKRPSRHF